MSTLSSSTSPVTSSPTTEKAQLQPQAQQPQDKSQQPQTHEEGQEPAQSQTQPPADIQIESTKPVPQSTAAASSPASSTPKPTSSKPRKPRCGAKDCRAIAAPIIGDCGFCRKHYCTKHRIVEAHSCEGLEDLRRIERERNKDKLEGERTVAIKGL